ncbi:hypothetical protein GOV09_05775 [Candidatus Woesearchaeota archaeon]|nr:hypothetical protein [Candidatus Woesearchaeota archaeon]
MKKRYLFIFAVLLVIIACEEQEEYSLCPDGITQVLDLNECPLPKPQCGSCDDGNECTRDICNEGTNYSCTYDLIKPCVGNGICESGEYPGGIDCPNNCEDTDSCTLDSFDFAQQKCIHNSITPCCGNDKCEAGETFVYCPVDCEQRLSLKITNFDRRQYVSGAFIDLTGTDRTYLIVTFKIHNINIDEEEELNFDVKNGFLYDPFKMRIEDENQRYYDVEYDSNLLPGYLDYIIIQRGGTKGASLMFTIPLSAQHVRMIAYDRFGSRLDTADLY